MKKLLILMAAFFLMSSYAYAEYYNYGSWNFEVSGGAYGVDGWVGTDGIDRIIYYSEATAHIYQVTTTAGPDGDNPNLHPFNPDATGAIAPRVFAHESSFTLNDTNYSHECEFYVGSDGFYLGAKNGIEKYDFDGTYMMTIGGPSPMEGGYSTQSLAYDVNTNDWWAGSIGFDGIVEMFSLDGDNLAAGWSEQFTYTTPGSHHDGLEMLANGNLLAADYTGQIQEYTQGGSLVATHDHLPWDTELEGMGYGALGHFWGGSHTGNIFEFGGGSIDTAPVPEPSTILLMGIGLAGLVGYSRKKKLFRNK